MKEYKYTIDGKEYKVEIGDITDNVADVRVNGEAFKVEMEPEAEPEKKKVVLGKPADAEDAKAMLRKISGRKHRVITGVCFTTTKKQHHFSVSTDVTFKTLTEEEIDYYVTKYKPFDKAGAYGIQEWIGYVGVKRLEGSYFNVMGLPVQRIWEELKLF